MHRRSLSNDYKNYPYVLPTRSSPVRTSHNQNYDPVQHTEQALYANTILDSTYTSSNGRRHSQTLPVISDLSEPLSIFDERKPSVRLRSNTNSLPSGYIPPNPIKRSSVSDARLATANAMRERLLTDIQDNITEIDRELSTLEVRPSIPSYVPPRFPSTTSRRPTYTSIQEREHSPSDEDQSRRRKPKKVYEVVSKTTSASSTASKRPTSKSIDQSTMYSFVGQYHYGAELGESEIDGADPENTEFESPLEEIPIATYETISTEQFLRVQSPLPLERVLIFVQMHGNKKDVRNGETTADLEEKIPAAIKVDRSSVVSPLPDLISTDKLIIQDFDLLIKTAPEPKVEIVAQTIVEPPETSDMTDDEIINTMFSKPLKHARLSTRTLETLSDPHLANKNSDKTSISGGYFFSDFGNEGDGEGEEDLISLDLSNFAVPLSSDMMPDDTISQSLLRQSQISLPNPHRTHPQQHPSTTNPHDKETESKKNDLTKKDIITAPPTSPSKQTLPTSANNNMPSQSTKNNNNNYNNEHSRQTSRKLSNVNTMEPPTNTKSTKSSFHFNSSLLALEHKDMTKAPTKNTILPEKEPVTTNKQSRIPRQRSSSVRNGSKIPTTTTSVGRQSTISPDANKRLTNQHKLLGETRRTSVLPVPLHSIDVKNERLSASRSTTPERRNSIPSLDQNLLFSLLDIIHFDEPMLSLSETQNDEVLHQNNSSAREQKNDQARHNDETSIERNDTLTGPTSKLKSINEENTSSPLQLTEEELPPITTTQQCLKSKPTDDQLSHTHIVDVSSMNPHDKPQQHFHVFFCNNITPVSMQYSNSCDGHFNTLSTNKDFARDKYSFLKSQINHVEYYSRKTMSSPNQQSFNSHIGTGDNQHMIQLVQPVSLISIFQLFDQCWSPTNEYSRMFHKLSFGNAESKVKSSSVENFPHESYLKIINTRCQRHNGTNLTEPIQESSFRPYLTQAASVVVAWDNYDRHFRQRMSATEPKVSRQTLRRNTEPVIHNMASLICNLSTEVKYSSELDLHQLSKSQHSESFNIADSYYRTFFLTETSTFNDYMEETFNDESQEESPPNRPKWNAVSKKASVNFIYNPKVPNSNSIRKGWDHDLRRKRVHKLPPLEQTSDRYEKVQLAIEAPPSNGRLAIDYSYDNSMNERSNRTTPSRRSSRALVPIQRLSANQLISDTPRSQRPVHQEWYDDLNRSHRMDLDRTMNTSFRDSYHQSNTSRELVPLHSLTQHSLMNTTILDSSIRTNRATELRLSRDLDQHHHHSHDVNQFMPIEIRGFHLKGNQLTTPDDAKIRPLSNVNYRTSERVKTRRTYPFGDPSQYHPSNRHNSLVPIAEFRQSSFATSIVEMPQSIHEE